MPRRGRRGAPCASKWSRASVIGSPVSSASSAMTFCGKPERGVDAGADGGAAERNLGDAGERRLHALDAEPDLPGVAAELLAEGDGGGIHEVGAAGLDDASSTAPPSPRATTARWSSAGMRSSMQRAGDGDVHRGGEDVVGRLRGVDVVVGVHRRAERARWRASRAPRSCSCSRRCRSRSGRCRSGTGRGARRR